MTEAYNVTPQQAASMLQAMITLNRKNAENGTPRRGVMIWGSMGIGKSSVVKQIANEMGYEVIDERLSQIDPSDLRGIPVPTKNKDEVEVNWAIPSHFPKDGCKDTLLFLDELPNANPAVQQAAYQLILDGQVGQYKLPNNVVVIAAGNTENDKGAIYRMPAPLVNRFIHIEMATSFDDWYTFALNSNFNSLVVSYLQKFRDHLFQFNPDNCSRGFATPRSWEAVSEIMNLDIDDVKTKEDLIIGAIGLEVASQFMSFATIASKIPDVEDIFKGKVKKWNIKDHGDTIGLEYAVINIIAAGLKRKANDGDYEKCFENAFNFLCTQMNAEMVTVAVTTMIKRLKLSPVVKGEFGEWLKKNAETFKLVREL